MLWDCLETLPINRASEHGRENIGGGYGIRRWENLASMGASGPGASWLGEGISKVAGSGNLRCTGRALREGICHFGRHSVSTDGREKQGALAVR